MKSNKKGMTLVECIIAMAVFAIATTGFTMSATAAMRAQAKAHNRNKIANEQNTDLEHFSNYSQVVDLNELNVTPMDPSDAMGKNMYQIKYDFNGIEVVNNKVHGYRAAVDEKDSVYELSFFSPIDQVMLEPNEYWITLYNCTPEDRTWDITCDGDGIEFFDNEKRSLGNTLPRHIWGGNGEYKRFGVRLTDPLKPLEIVINDPITHETSNVTVDLSDKINISGEDDRYGYVYCVSATSFVSYSEYEP